jgi:hypothetical protein
MKKNLILIMAVFTILTFGTATSSHAFVGLTTVTVICAAIFATAVGVDKVVDKVGKKQAPLQKQGLANDVKSLQGAISLSPGTP